MQVGKWSCTAINWQSEVRSEQLENGKAKVTYK